MKKTIILCAAIVAMVAVVCVAAYAFWDQPQSNLTFDATNAVGQGVAISVNNGVAAESATLIPSGALKTGTEKTIVMMGSAVIKYTAPNATEAVLKSKVNTFTPTVKKFVVGSTDITTTWTGIFEIWIAKSASDNTANKVLIGSSDKTDAYVSLTDTNAYVYMKFKKDATQLNSSDYAEKNMKIDITFTIA